MKRALLALLLAGCTKGYYYQHNTEDVRLTDNTMLITANAPAAFANQADMLSFVMLRAAERGKEYGYPYFTIDGVQDESKAQAYYIPGQVHSTGNATGYASTFGNTTTMNLNSQVNTYTTPATSGVHIHPGASAAVTFHKEKPKAGGFSVEEVLRNLGPKLAESE